MLIGAIPRQGKSFSARLVSLAAALDPHVRLYVYDLKGSPDWRAFAQVAHRFGLGDVPDPETGVDPVRALLTDMIELRAEVDHRYRTLRSLPASICPEGKLTPELSRQKALGMPLALVSIDEIQRAFEHRELGAELEDVLTDLAKVAPGAGIMLICSTQKPDPKATPARFRDQFGIRFALQSPRGRCPTWCSAPAPTARASTHRGCPPTRRAAGCCAAPGTPTSPAGSCGPTSPTAPTPRASAAAPGRCATPPAP